MYRRQIRRANLGTDCRRIRGADPVNASRRTCGQVRILLVESAGKFGPYSASLGETNYLRVERGNAILHAVSSVERNVSWLESKTIYIGPGGT